MEARLLKQNSLHLNQQGENQNMFGFRAKRGQATKKWHAKAMLIDPKKTRLTIVGSETDYASFEQLQN